MEWFSSRELLLHDDEHSQEIEIEINSAMRNCSTHFDCTSFDEDGNKIFKRCYLDVGWSMNPSFCNCSSWYGFTGSNCNHPSFQSEYYKVSLFLQVIWSAFLCLFLLSHLLKYIYEMRRTKRIVSILAASATLAAVFLVLGFLLLNISTVLFLRAMLVPTRFSIQKQGFITGAADLLMIENGRLAMNALMLGYCCFVLAAMQIAVTWIDTAQEIWKLFDRTFRRRAVQLKRFFKVATIGCVFLSLSLSFVDFYNAVGFALIIMMFFLCGLFLFGRHSFLKALEKNLSGSPADEQVIRIRRVVDRSCKFHLAMFGLVITLSLVFSTIAPNFQNYIAVGEFNYILVIRDAGTFLVLLTSTMDVFYLKNIFQTIVHNKKVALKPKL